VNPIVVHVVRPYATEQEYLAAEAWSIDQRSMLLIDAEALPSDSAVLFDVALGDGQKRIRAEGRVVGHVAPSGGRPGGLKVRFKRFGAATKAFIERAVQAKSSPSASAPSSPAASAQPERPSLPELRVSMTELEAAAPSAPEAAAAKAPAREQSSIRPRVPGPVAAPANRDELLARLRERRRAG
jgi:hypothetical protein